MREIIFRGKRIDNGEWVEGGSRVANWGSDGNKKSHTYEHVFILRQGATIRSHRDENNIQHLDCQVFEVIPETIGQYTGLEDRNGKKIFEGDMLPVPDDEIDKAIVEFGSGSFRVSLYGTTGAMTESGWDETAGGYGIVESEPIECFGVSDVEAIGSIHDNPELLKQ